MSLKDWLEDTFGKSPSPHDGNWTWDEPSLLLAEQVGHRLYLLLRDRLQVLRIPHEVHNELILRLVTCHDEHALASGEGQATLITMGDEHQDLVPMAILDGREFPTRISEDFGGFFEK